MNHILTTNNLGTLSYWHKTRPIFSGCVLLTIVLDLPYKEVAVKKYAVILVLLIVLLAVIPASAGNKIYCSDFDIVAPIPVQQVPGSDGEIVNWVPAGTYNSNILVDCDCYISAGAFVEGNVIEKSGTDWSIYIDASARITGNIEEKGNGSVFFNIGQLGVHTGDIEEKGPGQVWVWVDGFFNGNVEESGPGRVRVDIFGDYPSAGPGTYNGYVMEKGSGDGELWIEAPGAYNGDFSAQGQGTCYVRIETPDLQPNGTINCKTVEYIDW
jgi:hypothetical protein